MAHNPERLVRDLGTRMEENIAWLDRLQIQQDLFKQGITLSSLVDFALSHDTLNNGGQFVNGTAKSREVLLDEFRPLREW
jgi:hypothetical protein